MYDVPIAWIVFNRPQTSQRTFAILRDIRPRRLYVIADGPREHIAGEVERVRETRAIIDSIDWRCDVVRIFSDRNLGCGFRIRSGISKAFATTDKLVILEDDCLPDPSFFQFTRTLLNRYEANLNVMSISGNCFLDPVPNEHSSYYFSKYSHCWGWATWRRAWRLYDARLEAWSEFTKMKHFGDWISSEFEARYWEHTFQRIADKKIDTWDYQWLLSCWINQGLAVLPTRNLVSNIGFTAEATHTRKPNAFAELPTSVIGDIVAPDCVVRNGIADRATDEAMYSGVWKPPSSLQVARHAIRRKWADFARRRAA